MRIIGLKSPSLEALSFSATRQYTAVQRGDVEKLGSRDGRGDGAARKRQWRCHVRGCYLGNDACCGSYRPSNHHYKVINREDLLTSQHTVKKQYLYFTFVYSLIILKNICILSSVVEFRLTIVFVS